MIYNTLLDENFPTCLRAVFENREAAEAAESRVKRIAGVEAAQLRIVVPTDCENAPVPSAGIDTPGSRTKRDFFLRSAVLGLLVGALLGTALVAARVQDSPTHPVALFAASCTLGMIAALLLAGLTSWRRTSPGPLTHLPAYPEERGFALEIEVHDLSEQHAVRQALAGLDAQIELAGSAGGRTVPQDK